jgi:hypothetical protein
MNATSGHPINIYDIDGLPPLPSQVDDDHITTETVFPQSASRVSFMVGFVAVARIFQLAGKALVRQRTWQDDPEAGPTREALLSWIDDATHRLHEIVETHAPNSGVQGENPSNRVFGDVQRANIHVTSLCTEFTLVSPSISVRRSEISS